MVKKITIIANLLIILVATSSCARFSLEERYNKAKDIAAISNMHEDVIEADIFDITTWQRVRTPHTGDTINIYIEGDGLAWLSKYKVSPNPTPTEPLMLELASRDRSPNVIYMARPCQYTGWIKEGYCSSIYWTGGRTAPEVIKSFQSALDQIKMKYGNKDFYLTGYSGGAAVAAILAANRDDVKALRTIAGNLDYQTFTNYHKVSPLYASMDPINFAYEIRNIPQLHLVGGSDKIVPEIIFDSWAKTSDNPQCVKDYVVAGVTHEDGWLDEWNRLQTMYPTCQ